MKLKRNDLSCNTVQNLAYTYPVSQTDRLFHVGIRNIAPSEMRGDVENGYGVRWCILIYNKAREQSPEAANAVLQIQIADGLWCDR